MIIIGISGKAKSGKDTLANFIIEEFGQQYKIKKYAFADALREEIKGKEYEFSVRYNLPLKPDVDGKWRHLMQFWGDYRRKESLYYWVLKVSRAIDNDTKNGLQVALISDVRLKNEAMFVKSRGGSLVRVECYGAEINEEWRNHKSETDLDLFTFDYTVTCGKGDLKSLRQDAKTVFQLIRDELDLTKFMREQLEGEENILPLKEF